MTEPTIAHQTKATAREPWTIEEVQRLVWRLNSAVAIVAGAIGLAAILFIDH